MPNKEQTHTASLHEAIALLKLVRVDDDDTQETIDEFLDKMESPIVEIRTDTMPENPREDCDNAGVMYCQHRRYTLGDKDADDPFREEEGIEIDGRWIEESMAAYASDCLAEVHDELIEAIEAGDDTSEYGAWSDPAAINAVIAELDAFNSYETRRFKRDDVAIVLPLYLYDHGGITMSHGAFSDPWDSGCVGVHYMTRKVLDEEFGGDEAKARACLGAELKTYDQYLQGNVWGFNIEDRSGTPIESCWGFYGDALEETGMLEHVEKRLHKAMHEAWENRFASQR